LPERAPVSAFAAVNETTMASGRDFTGETVKPSQIGALIEKLQVLVE
jgi:hypothetical protein